MTPSPQVIVFHGTGSSPEGNWFRWLQHELEARGISAAIPAFPTPDGHRTHMAPETARALAEQLERAAYDAAHAAPEAPASACAANHQRPRALTTPTA